MYPIDIDYVIEFATKAHGDQKRKYTGEPYIEHPMAVARIVGDAVTDKRERNLALAAALLHDTVEDTDVTIDNITDHFGDEVAELVGWLTDVSKPEDGNRAHRKAMDRAHIADAPPLAKTVKLADMIDNSISITEHDPNFAKVYMVEKAMLLDVLEEGDADLHKWASQIVDDWFAKNRG